MKMVAVTGGIGSGKSLVSAEFERLGAYVLDADKIYHELIRPDNATYNEVVEYFGEGILGSDREIDRKMLADIVFNDKEKLEALNKITHKNIYAELKHRAESSGADIVCLEIPLLFSAECPLDLELTIAVLAPVSLRVERVIKRDNCSAEKVIERISNQLSDAEMRQRADCVIINDGNLEAVRKQVKEVYDSLI